MCVYISLSLSLPLSRSHFFSLSLSLASITGHKLPGRYGSSFDIRSILLRDQARFIWCNNNVYPYGLWLPRVFYRGQFYCGITQTEWNSRLAPRIRIAFGALCTLSALARPISMPAVRLPYISPFILLLERSPLLPSIKQIRAVLLVFCETRNDEMKNTE